MSSSTRPESPPRPVNTVLGPVSHTALGVTDAHNHLWIDPVAGADPASPVLNRFDGILADLKDYHQAGGGAMLDCQPPGCGRNGVRLAQLACESDVHVIACTGFHRRKYYPVDHWLWSASDQAAAEFFLTELDSALVEARATEHPVRAGFIKIACETELAETPQAALEGAAAVAAQSGALVEVHTEKGAAAEQIVTYFQDRQVPPRQLVLCHMDKRPDAGLHRDLAAAGVLLEYDTFYRPKYRPEDNLWPLIDEMVKAGLSDCLALATDMAEAELYSALGSGPGLASLPTAVRSRLAFRGVPETMIRQMLGENIARRLAGLK